MRRLAPRHVQLRSVWSKLTEANAAWRRRSEDAHALRKDKINQDYKQHRQRISQFRDALHNQMDQHTAHPPPKSPYTQNAFPFPAICPLTLQGESCQLAANSVLAGKLTLLGCSGARFSETMINSWLDGVNAVWQDTASRDNDLQVLRLSLMDAKYSWLSSVMLASMRWSISKDQQDSFLVYFGDFLQLQEKIGMINRFLGYVCLIDERGLIRWHVHSSRSPTEEEVSALIEIIRAKSWLSEPDEISPPRRSQKGRIRRT